MNYSLGEVSRCCSTAQVVSAGVGNCSVENLRVEITFEDVDYLPDELEVEENPVMVGLHKVTLCLISSKIHFTVRYKLKLDNNTIEHYARGSGALL